MTHMWSF